MPSAEASRANGKKGGRPQGGKNDDKAVVVRQRIADAAERIVQAHLSVALGAGQLYRRDGIVTSRVTDEEEVFRFFNGEVGPEGYVLINTVDPDPKACDALLSRAFGKPKEAVEVSGSLSYTVLTGVPASKAL